ncbi:MAG: hypothetical protein K6U80_08560 [Firmicutes bacterium]|nr:hypothetical protein [Bacillota bacterium]
MEPKEDIKQIVTSDLFNSIKSVGSDIEAANPDKSVKIAETRDPEELYNIINRTILKNWDRKTNQDIDFQGIYAWILLGMLVFQVLAINVIVFGIGLKWLVFDKWVIDIFIVSVFGEVTGLALIIVNYLFPKTQDNTNELMKKMQDSDIKS